MELIKYLDSKSSLLFIYNLADIPISYYTPDTDIEDLRPDLLMFIGDFESRALSSNTVVSNLNSATAKNPEACVVSIGNSARNMTIRRTRSHLSGYSLKANPKLWLADKVKSHLTASSLMQDKSTLPHSQPLMAIKHTSNAGIVQEEANTVALGFSTDTWQRVSLVRKGWQARSLSHGH